MCPRLQGGIFYCLMLKACVCCLLWIPVQISNSFSLSKNVWLPAQPCEFCSLSRASDLKQKSSVHQSAIHSVKYGPISYYFQSLSYHFYLYSVNLFTYFQFLCFNDTNSPVLHPPHHLSYILLQLFYPSLAPLLSNSCLHCSLSS